MIISSGGNQVNYIQAVSEIVGSLIKAYEAQVSINLSKIKAEVHDLCKQREALSEYFKIAII
jgi:hypothetical protein